MELDRYLTSENRIVLKQIRQMIEFIGATARSRYEIYTEQGMLIGRAEERAQGFLWAIFRQAVKHWRRFSIDIFDCAGSHYLHFEHPFRFFFQRLNMERQGHAAGSLERQLSFTLSKVFNIESLDGSSLTMRAPLWKIWSFPIYRGSTQVATIQKKWGAMLNELFTDADTFYIEFNDPGLTLTERQLILGTALLIDVQYFENNQGFNLWSFGD